MFNILILKDSNDNDSNYNNPLPLESIGGQDWPIDDGLTSASLRTDVKYPPEGLVVTFIHCVKFPSCFSSLYRDYRYNLIAA